MKAAPGWVPQQHGAWAMLAVPALVGMLRAGPAPVHALLLPWWFVAYFAFNAAALFLRSRGQARYRVPLLVYGGTTAAGGLALLALRPDLAAWAPAFVPLAAVSLVYSWRRRDRALVNDAATIAAACLFGAVAYAAGRPPGAPADWPAMAWVVVALFAYFFGTALYVKTVIRERSNPAYHRASVGYHAAWALAWAASGLVGVPVGSATRIGLVVFFVVLTVRAALLAGRRVRPLVVGLGEMAASVVIAVLTLTW